MDKRLPIRNWFDVAYENGAPWDIGRPQPALVRVADEGLVHGRVLEVGCGTGELLLELARRGHEVVGVEASRVAIGLARTKASQRGLSVRVEEMDALELGGLGAFDTVVDCGLFHIFSDQARAKYEASVGRVLAPGGVLHLLCWSDAEPAGNGPRRVSQSELRRTFRSGWSVLAVREVRYEHRLRNGGASAWLMTAVRTPGTSFVH